jgi:hypothetical protein
VDVPATSFQLHEWDIHIVCRGTDDASGAGDTAAAAVAILAGTLLVAGVASLTSASFGAGNLPASSGEVSSYDNYSSPGPASFPWSS